MEKISSNVYVETGFRGSNDGFIVTTEGIVMIDSPQFAVDALNWRDMVGKYGEVKYIINTEPHIDHVFGSFYFKGTVIGHEGIRQTLLALDSEQVKQSRKGTEDYTMMDGWHFRPPTITFSRDLTLYIGKHTFKLINMPGHTPYQTAILIPEEKVVFTSDNLVYKTPPFMTEALPIEWLQSLKDIDKLDANILVPGHGDVCDKRALPEMAAMIQEWLDTVKNAIAEGLTLEEAQKAIKVLDRWELEPSRKQRIHEGAIKRLYEIFKK